MKLCHTNYSQIFSLYSDRDGILDALRAAAKDVKPDFDFIADNGEDHKLWRITDPDVHKKVTDAMENNRLFIADGHHRYETAMNYKAWAAENDPDFNEDHPANFVMMYLCSMQDPGLVVLAAHRMLKDIPESELQSFYSTAEEYFDIKIIPFGESREKAQTEFMETLAENSSNKVIGTVMKGRDEFRLLALKPDTMDRVFGDELAEALKDLDVTVLTNLIFMKILGFDKARLDNKKLIDYSSKENEAIDSVLNGKNDIAFILNPTKIEQVREIAEQGLIMPRKATYFYPKVITGQVINHLK